MTDEIKNVMKYFPNVKLSYENKVYKKVYNNFDYYTAIPYAKKYFAWFKSFYNKNNLYIMELNIKKKTIVNISKKTCSFSNNICNKDGTIFFGSIIKYKNIDFFCIEDIFYSFGKNISNLNKNNKLNILDNILENHLNQEIYSKNSISFGLPIMTDNIDNLSEIIYNSPYKIWSIKYNSFTNNNVYYEKVNIYSIYSNFIVKPCIIPDVYDLYLMKNHKLTFYNKCVVSNYKNSVKMNLIFRNIKENINLDFLEESDDEEEFENISPDKFVDLNMQKIMKCSYNSNFKLWEPIEIATEKVTNFDLVKQIENNM